MPRGTKMSSRRYHPDVVERARKRRHTPKVAPDLCKVAAGIAGARLLEYADETPIFFGVAPRDTERVRKQIRAIAQRLVAADAAE